MVRNLTANDVECRVLRVDKTWCQLTLYKDARCDMRILDEMFTPFGWQRRHEVINDNLFCTVSVFDKGKGLWIEKQDVGTESRTEKEKGEASDAFKRACTNFGIGRELYSQPVIFVDLKETEVLQRKDRNDNTTYVLNRKVAFSPVVLEVNDHKLITKLIIVDQDGIERFCWERADLDARIDSVKLEIIKKLIEETNSKERSLLNYIGKKFYKEIKSLDQLTVPQWKYGVEALEEKKRKPAI